MEEIISILEDIQPGVDYANAKDLIDAHLFDSLSVISLVAELEEAFDITIPAVEVKAENFNSAEALYKMVERLKEEG